MRVRGLLLWVAVAATCFALAIGAILAEAGVPAGVVNVIPSSQYGKVVGTLPDEQP